MSTPSQRSSGFLLAGVTLTSLAVRTAYLVALRPAIDSADSIHYIAMAQQFAAGDFASFDENLPVLFSLLAALAHLAIADWEAAFWAVSIAASSLTAIPVVLLSRELHGAAAAKVTAVLIALWPWLIDYATRIQPEALSVCLWFTSVWLTYRAVATGGRYLACAPLALFALHLTRPEGTLLMLAAPFGAALLCRGEGRERIPRVLTLAAIIMTLAAVYMLAMRALIGTATVSYRAPMTGDLADYFQRGGIELGKTFLQVTFNAWPVMLGPLLMPFMGLGAFSKPPGRDRFGLEAFIVVFCLVQYAATLANFSPAPRYIMPIVVSCGLWSAWGIVRADALLRESRLHRWTWLPLTLTVASFGLGIATSLAADRFGRMPATPIEYRTSGHWLRDNAPPGLILTRKPQIGFYAGMPTTGPDVSDTVSSLLERAAATGARYIAVDARYTAPMVPGIAGLLDPATAPANLKLLHSTTEGAEAAVVIYEVAIPGMRYLPPEEFPRPDSHMGPDERRRKPDAPEAP